MRTPSRLLLVLSSLWVCAACAATPDATPRAQPENAPMTAPESAAAARPADGAYAGRIGELQQSVSLQIRPDASARLVVLYALHTPPALVEEYEGRLVQQGDGWCLEPAPQTVQPCLDLSDGALGLTRLSGERIGLRPLDR
ncbi:MAG: hypothetical protein ABW163_08445 [Luteimonas sp.]